MAVESAQFIAELDKTLPASGGVAGEGDDHVRMMKDVLLGTVPFDKLVRASADDLNLLAGMEAYGLTSVDLQRLAELEITAVQLNRLAFPVTTNMVFYNATPPAGWVIAAVQTGSALRVVDLAGAGGFSGNASGVGIGAAVDLNHSHADNFNFTTTAAGSHNHTGSTGNAAGGGSITTGLNSAGSSIDHTHTLASQAAHTHAMSKTGSVQASTSVQFSFKYMNVIVCHPAT